MALDKEMLLRRLQSQYLTRQEVLFKLPLNLSINSFWPELLERRKLNGVVLPLHRADGKPLWYVLTDKMIAASEKLCAKSLDCNTTIDPYKTAITSAITEELFFTSFVEGAQINLKEAMDFLERGLEPENVQEQLIQNNLNAWTDMMRALYYPIDDRFVRMLAYRLTEELEGHATDYRQTDTHTIGAMGAEAYDVPAASSLPALMQEYYDFLASTEVHPLIKAAVGHGFLLITRPFPDGNERLSRMISYAILLRSGYDFFRDISISSVIARETFRYFKSMQDIIRSDSDGDLTYFVEYYMDLLARSLDAQAEQEQRRQQEALMKEREAATKPLQKADSSIVSLSISPAAQTVNSEKTIDIDPNPPVHETENEPKGHNSDEGVVDEHKPNESPPGQLYTEEEYLKLLNRLKRQPMTFAQEHRRDRIIPILVRLATEGPSTFRRLEWEQMADVPTYKAKEDIKFMRLHGLIYAKPVNSDTEAKQYYLPLTVTKPEPHEDPKPKSDQKGEDIRQSLICMTKSDYQKERQMATGLLDMLDRNQSEFTFSDWISRNPSPGKDAAFSILRTAINHGYIVFENGIYQFVKELPKGPKCYHMPDKQRELLLKLMEYFPDEKFTIRDASGATGITYSTMGYYLDNLTQRGILTVEKGKRFVNLYSFSSEVHGIFESMGMRDEQTAFKALPDKEKDIHDPLQNAAEAG